MKFRGTEKFEEMIIYIKIQPGNYFLRLYRGIFECRGEMVRENCSVDERFERFLFLTARRYRTIIKRYDDERCVDGVWKRRLTNKSNGVDDFDVIGCKSSLKETTFVGNSVALYASGRIVRTTTSVR